MSVLIKDMDMPKDCDCCRFSGIGGVNNEFVVCMFTGENDFKNQQKRFRGCPLVQVPTHGRLIDADELKYDYCKVFGDEEMVYRIIDNSPTVIEPS